MVYTRVKSWNIYVEYKKPRAEFSTLSSKVRSGIETNLINH